MECIGIRDQIVESLKHNSRITLILISLSILTACRGGGGGQSLAESIVQPNQPPIVDTGGTQVEPSQPTIVDVSITRVEPNQPPIADAGSTQIVDEGTIVTLDGTKSSDPESKALTFSWTQLSGTPATLSSATTAKPHFTVNDVSLPDETLEFQLVVSDSVNESTASTVEITVNNVTHDVDISKELMITDLSVVESAHSSNGGQWTFKHLITQMMPQTNPTAREKSDFVLSWLSQWTTTQSINGFDVPSRAQMQTRVIDPWLLASGGTGELSLSLAPFRLLGIVNRLDLAKKDASGNIVDAGEARFVFGVLDSSGFPTQFTAIFEYGLPATNEQELYRWINDWHNLSLQELSTVDPAYNNALLALTDRFTRKNANPLKINGSAINQIRTNEIELGFTWELREFNLSSVSGMLTQVTVKDNPDLSIANSTLIRDLINSNESEILKGGFSVPETFNLQAVLAGSSINSQGMFSTLNPSGVNNSEARHKLSLNTCMGCHGAETNTSFLHVFPRAQGFEAELSGFLKGDINSQPIIVTDPVDGTTTREFFTLKDRKKNLRCLMSKCPPTE